MPVSDRTSAPGSVITRSVSRWPSRRTNGDRAGAGQHVDVGGPHRFAAFGAAQLDMTELAAGVVPVQHRRPGLSGQPLVSPGHHHHEHLEELQPLGGQEVALTIDTNQGTPGRSLSVRGVAAIEIVDGVPDEYLAASGKTMDAEQARQFEANVRSTYKQMARITIQPQWARYYDFGAGRIPGFLLKLVQESQAR
jgi:hypothetical protein